MSHYALNRVLGPILFIHPFQRKAFGAISIILAQYVTNQYVLRPH